MEATALRVHIRWMIQRDVEEVLAIEAENFEYPWGEPELIRVLRVRNTIGMVAEHEDKIVGFMVWELHKTKLQVLNFAVAKEYQHRGVGRQMVDKLTGELSPHRRNRIMLEVRDSNLAAQQFLRKCGFKATSIMRNFYEDCDDDAYVFVYRVKS